MRNIEKIGKKMQECKRIDPRRYAIYYSIFMLIMLVLLSFTATVTATTIGDGYTVGGYNAGWVLLIIGIVLALAGWGMAALKTMKKPIVAFGIAFFFIGAAMLTISVPTPTTGQTTGTACCDFGITGASITGTEYIATNTWDESTNTLTIPLTVADSSDGNLTGSRAGVNLTIEAFGEENTELCKYTITSDYTMTYGGEYILDKTGSDYRAEITTTTGTEYNTDEFQVAAGSTAWANVSYIFVNGTSGSWVSELTQIGDSITWYITVQNACGETERITITAMVVAYTA